MLLTGKVLSSTGQVGHCDQGLALAAFIIECPQSECVVEEELKHQVLLIICCSAQLFRY